MTSLGLRVVAPYGATGASTRVRALDWLEHLGMDAQLSTYLGTSTTQLGVLRRDVTGVLRAETRLRRLVREPADGPVLLVRNASPLSNGRLEEALMRSARRGVYDFDDALMVPQPGLANAVFSRARTWRRAVESADVVIAGNEYLADAASSHNSSVTVVPSCVEPDAYRFRPAHGTGSAPVAVWLGSPSTEPYLALIGDALLAEHRRSGLRLRLISSGAAPLGPLSPMVDRVAWAPGLAEETLAEADMGLMPLPDDPWTRGKCGYKLLQYAAAGLPVVGSPVGVNREVLVRLGGLAAVGASEWGDALRHLVDLSAADRAAMGAVARAGVQANYSFNRWAGPWRRAVTDD